MGKNIQFVFKAGDMGNNKNAGHSTAKKLLLAAPHFIVKSE